jgi:hypothetical protein
VIKKILQEREKKCFGRIFLQRAIKKAHPTNQMSFYKDLKIVKLVSDLSVPPMKNVSSGMELAPCPGYLTRIGCQGFNGPLPSAFLDK